MVEFRWSKATLLLTVLAVLIAVMSLFLEWYSCDVVSVSDDRVYLRHYEFYVTGILTGSGITFYEQTSWGVEVGNVIGAAAGLIVLWALFSLVYISAVFDGESGFYRGWAIIVLSIMPVAVYALFIQDAAEEASAGIVESRLSLGPFVALFAAVLQTGAALARNLQVLNPTMSATGVEKKQEELGRGDLPER